MVTGYSGRQVWQRQQDVPSVFRGCSSEAIASFALADLLLRHMTEHSHQIRTLEQFRRYSALFGKQPSRSDGSYDQAQQADKRQLSL